MKTTHTATHFATPAVVVLVLLWAGMLFGVSFLATPAKFLAPSLSLAVALDVGRQTFGIFNPIEIGCGIALVMLLAVSAAGRWAYLAGALVYAAVAAQTVWLLPVLDARVGMIIAGETPPPSSLHNVYIWLDVLKLVTLLCLALGTLWWRILRPAGSR